MFERSFYVVLDRQWICIGPPALGPGPLNALYAGPNSPAPPPLGAPAAVTRGMLHVDGRSFARLELGPEPPPAAPRPWSAASLAAGLRAFAVLPRPPDGFADPAVARAAAAPIAWLKRLITDHCAGIGHAHEAAPLAPLLGLGPGLTPSGDDFVGGGLVALAALGLSDLRDTLWSALRPQGGERTSDISLAHLAAAAEGECAPALRHALEAIMANAPAELPGAVGALARIGHTSGLDAMAGAVLVLRAFAQASRPGAAQCAAGTMSCSG